MKPLTYCNPLSIENMAEGRWLDASLTHTDPRTLNDYRSVSDPSVIFWEGKWILYPSYGLAWVSEDFVHWKYVDIGVPHMTYSPAIAQFRGKWYLTGHTIKDMYVADSPLGPFKVAGPLTDCKGNPIFATDCCLMADGDDGLYIYWYRDRPQEAGENLEACPSTVAARLDSDEPWKMVTEPVVINWFESKYVWQRTGENNQNARMGWIEGQWAFKIGKRYYLLYSGCGTQFAGYCNAILYSDEGPLSGWKMQKNHNPLTEKRTGYVRGAGHGCVAQGPNDTLWCFYTCVFGYNHQFERRIGMDPLGIDENGEIYCKECTETPQYAPGVLPHPEKGNGTGWLNLTANQRPTATSCAPGRDSLYAADGSVYTFWQPAADDKEPVLTIELGRTTAYTVRSFRIVWRDIGMEILDGVNPGAFQYVVEYADTQPKDHWVTLLDESENEKDLPIDYREFEPVRAFAIRLRILGAPKGITPAVSDFAAFGECCLEGYGD